MKKIIFLCVMSMISLVTMGQGIHFEKISLEQALAKAKNENKLLFVDCYAVWCAPCKWMMQNTFKEPEVVSLFDSSFVALKVNIETADGKRIRDIYNIEGLPGYAFIDAGGDILLKARNTMKKEEFLGLAREAIVNSRDSNSLGRLKAQYSQRMNDEKFMLRYLDKLNQTATAVYVDELEQFLKITTLNPRSKEMVDLIYKHNAQIVYGRRALSIVNENFDSEEWKTLVRKDIRAMFQKLNRQLPVNSLRYAIAKNDEQYVSFLLSEAKRLNLKVDNAKQESVYLEYYTGTNNAVKIKEILAKRMNDICKKTQFDALRKMHLSSVASVANLSSTSAMDLARTMANNVVLYEKHVNTPQEQTNVLEWMKLAYVLHPESSFVTNLYANLEYKYGDKSKAITLKKSVVAMPNSSSDYKEELDKMIKGEKL